MFFFLLFYSVLFIYYGLDYIFKYFFYILALFKFITKLLKFLVYIYLSYKWLRENNNSALDKRARGEQCKCI